MVGQPVDGGPAALFADLVVGLGRAQQLVTHQLGEHIERDAGVGVPLREGYLYSILKTPYAAALSTVGRRKARGARCPSGEHHGCGRLWSLITRRRLSRAAPVDLSTELQA